MNDKVSGSPQPPSQDIWCKVFEDPDVREVGGEHVNEGVDFARYWAISKVITLESEGAADYVLLFEYLQDVAVLDSSRKPTQAVLYQVKKKDRTSWTRAGLCKREKPPKPAGRKGTKALGAASPIGKLYLCVDRLSAHVTAYGVFLSNAPMNLRLQNGNLIPQYSKVSLVQLSSEELLHIEKKIAADLQYRAPLPKLSALSLEHTTIAPAAMRETIRGVVATYLAQVYPTLPNVSGQLVETLHDAFARLSGQQPRSQSLADLIRCKGFTREAFTGVIGELSKSVPFDTSLQRVIDGLRREDFPARRLTQLQNRAQAMKTLQVRQPATKESTHWNVAVEAATHFTDDYTSALNSVESALRRSFRDGGAPDRIDLLATSLLAIVHVDEQSTPSDPESQD